MKFTFDSTKIGDRYFQERRYDKALGCYQHAGDREKLLLVAKKLKPEEAIAVYLEIGAKQKIKELGERFERRRMFYKASTCYREIGDRKALRALAEKLLVENEFGLAIDCLNHAGAKKRLLELGEFHLRKHDLWNADLCFSTVRNRVKLSKIGDLYRERRRYFSACSCYQKAKALKRLLDLSKLLLQKSGLTKDDCTVVQMCFDFCTPPASLRIKLSEHLIEGGERETAMRQLIRANATDRLLQLGELCIEKLEYGSAFECFRSAGAPEKFREAAKQSVQEGRLGQAVLMYKILKEEGWRNADLCVGIDEEIIALGDSCVENNAPLEALECYELCRNSEKRNALGDALSKCGLYRHLKPRVR